MSVTPFVGEVMRACERAVARRGPCTVVAVVLGQGDAERVAQWCRTEAARLGAVYELATPAHAFDLDAVRVRVMSLVEAVRAVPRLPRQSIVVVDAGARIHADVEGVWGVFEEMVVACQG